jgi:ferredoxin
MSTRTIIDIDEEKCNGCGLCIPNCPEGALQVIDGKARLISDLFCDGLGACVGYCPEGAITLTQREAEPYDERKVMPNIVRAGANTIKAHLAHLDGHGETKLLAEALDFLKETSTPVPAGWKKEAAPAAAPAHCAPVVEQTSSLKNWPIQLHLTSPMAPQFKGQDVVLAADCVAFAAPNFHAMLDGKMLAIACPKLDDGKDIYKEKITALIDHAQVKSLTVLMMQVPCCRGLLAIAQQAREAAHRSIPIKAVIVGIDGGKVLSEETV